MAARQEEEIQVMDKELLQERRGFLKQFGATLGAAGLGAAGVGTAHAAAKPKGNIPDRPVKVGHTTFLTGPAELWAVRASADMSSRRRKSMRRAGCSASARSRRS